MVTLSTDILDELKAPFYRYVYVERRMPDGKNIGVIICFGNDRITVDICDWVADLIVCKAEAAYEEFTTPDEEYHGPAT